MKPQQRNENTDKRKIKKPTSLKTRGGCIRNANIYADRK